MDWPRLLLLGNVGQQLDIEDIEDIEGDVARLRARLAAQAAADETHEQALLTLRREVNDLKLVVAELVRLLVAGGTVPADAVDKIVRALEAPPRPVPPADRGGRRIR
jgi:hypothetical protein